MYVGMNARQNTLMPPLKWKGMGDAQLNNQINAAVTTGAEAAIGVLSSLHAVIGGVAFAGPIGAAIASGIAVASLIASMIGKGCGQSCVIASNDANKLEPLLQQNVQAYLASPVRYRSMQQAFLQNYDTVWNALVQACGDPSLADAGKRCVSDRQPGACHWKASPGGWVKNSDGTCTYTSAGPSGSGSACWNWAIGYRDPIANDPCVQPDPSPAEQASNALSDVGAQLSSFFGASTGGMDLKSFILPGLLLGAGVLVFAGSD